jgi:maltokinase
VSRRWFGSKTRTAIGARVLDGVLLAPGLYLLLAELRFPEGTHEIYQVLLPGKDGEVVWEDALAEPTLACELVRLIGAGAIVEAEHGSVELRAVGELGGTPTQARLIGAEQTNSSVIVDDRLFLKAYRRLEAGVNPELEVLRFLTERGFPNVAAVRGWYEYSGQPLGATLGILQDLVVGALDGWELALEELSAGPDRFLPLARRLGEVTGAMHTVLASDGEDPAFAPEEKGPEALGLLTATIDEEIAQVFLELPDDPVLAPIAGRGEEVREQVRSLAHLGSAGRVIRHHGDFHLGQTLWAAGDWLIVDFEGEPARTLPERRRKRSPLRDVAGMLRSFAYAALAVEILRGVEAPSDWEERARSEFLDGYFGSVDELLLPVGREATARLISLFELEKAVYELRYELDHRPDWVRIPVAGIARLLEQAAPV